MSYTKLGMSYGRNHKRKRGVIHKYKVCVCVCGVCVRVWSCSLSTNVPPELIIPSRVGDNKS